MCETELNLDGVIKQIVIDREQFKEVLDKADHNTLGQMVVALDVEMASGIADGRYKTVKYWEKNAAGSYAYVYSSNGKFASAKIAHNVRILLMEQYTITMIALTRKMFNEGVKII